MVLQELRIEEMQEVNGGLLGLNLNTLGLGGGLLGGNLLGGNQGNGDVFGIDSLLSSVNTYLTLVNILIGNNTLLSGLTGILGSGLGGL